LSTLKYLYLDRHVLLHGHEPLDIDNTAPEFIGEKWLLKHIQPLRRGADGVLRETP